LKLFKSTFLCCFFLPFCSLRLSAQAAPSATPAAAQQTQAVATSSAGLSAAATFRDALRRAQTIYIEEISDSRKPSADFLAFYDGMQYWARYQLVPTTAGADLIFRYGLNPQGAHLAVVDVKQGKLLGTDYSTQNSLLLAIPVPILDNILANKNKKSEAEWLVGFCKEQAGDSKPAGNVMFLPAPKELPKSLSSKQAKARLQAASKVFILNDGVPNGFFVGPQVPSNELQSQLASWPRYKLVSSIAEADLVIDVSGIGYVYTADYSRENTIRIDVEDAKTLQSIWYAWDAPPVKKHSYARLLYPVPLYADPEHDASVSVHNLINMWKKEVGDPVAK
jgi:hypothetical protein